jgi:NAD(P)H-flavin reductase
MQKPIHTIATLSRRQNADSGNRYFEVQLDLAEPVTYQAGQYLNLVIDGQRRSYSITNAPNGKPTQQVWLLVERLPDGLASRFLDTAPLGTTIEVVLPFGRLIPQADRFSRHVLVGTGSGIASLRPIADTLVQDANQSIVLLWGLRHPTNIFWHDWLERLMQAHANFRYVITLSQPDHHWQGLRGRVTEHLASIGIDTQSCFYLCGGKSMLDDVRAVLKEHGVASAQILTEQFHV